MRNFIINHEDYKQDSYVTDKIEYDLMEKLFLSNNQNYLKTQLEAKIDKTNERPRLGSVSSMTSEVL